MKHEKSDMFIFLDIDGVMVPEKSWKQPDILEDGFPSFSNKSSSVLKSLISNDTTFVLTTSHKSSYNVDEWKNIFKTRGINIDNIIRLPDNTNNLNRKDEILNWFKSNDVNENFIIIDNDKSLNSLPNHLKKNLILTNSMVGLTEQHLENIKSILNT